MRKEYRELMGLPIKTPMEYWIKYWEYYIDRLENDRERNVGLNGPRIILEALKAEVQFHNGTKNKEFFKVQINQWKKNDAAFSKLFSKEWNNLIQNHFDDDVKILEGCSDIISKMNNGDYFDILIECLRDTINNTDQLFYDKKRMINQYSQLLISEYIANNFSISDIRHIPEYLPTVKCNEWKDVLVAPNEYLGLKIDNYDTEKEYYRAIKNNIKNKNLDERLCEMKKFFHGERDNYTVIVEVQGIQGKMDHTFESINIYSPLVKHYIKDDNNWIETDEDANKRILAAISVENSAPDTAITIACDRLKNLLGLMTAFIEPTLSLSYNKEYALVLKDGISVMSQGIPSKYKNQDERWKKFRDYQLSIKEYEISTQFESLNKMFSNNTNRDETFNALSSARYWYVKARETNISEDKLLYSWIAIEGLCSIDDNAKRKILISKDSNKTVSAVELNKIDLITKIAKAIVMKSMFYYEWLDYYYFFRDSVISDNFYDIPQNIVSSMGLDLKGGELIPRAVFINGLLDLEKSINDEIKKNEIHDLYTFYKDRKGFDKRAQQLENDIRVLYYLRNMIVHNASFLKEKIDVYARKSMYISGAIIKKIQLGYAETSMNLDDMLVDISGNYDAFLQNFDRVLLEFKSN